MSINTPAMASVPDTTHPPKDDPERSKENATPQVDETSSDDDGEARKQEGVRQVEGITSAWTLRALILTYILCVGHARDNGTSKVRSN